MKQTHFSRDDFGNFLGLASLLFGGILRIFPVFLAGFPINDGGLFYAMTQAIQENGFTLPAYAHYNGLDIPFAYPPLGFYAAAIITNLFHVPLIEVFRWLPAMVLIGSLAAFFVLAKTILKSSIKAGFAALFFAFVPRSITWTIMGGGVTRSFGQLFFILTVHFVYQLFEKRSKKTLGYAILFGTLTTLSHPEAALHTVAVCLLIVLFKGKGRAGILPALMVAAGVVVLTSIWWIPVIQRFGLAPFLSAGQTGLHNTFGILYFLSNFGGEPAVTFVMVLAFVGIASSIIEKDYFLPLFFLLPFLVEPRNAANTSVIPLALLAADGFYKVVLPGLEHSPAHAAANPSNRSLYFVSAFLGIYLTVGMLYYTANISVERVTPQNLAGFDWVKTNTPVDSRFIVITGTPDIFSDWTQEWFPALTQRISKTTMQGREWLDGRTFLDQIHIVQNIQYCVAASASLDCIEKLTTGHSLTFDYVYVSTMTTGVNTDPNSSAGNNLIWELSNSADYTLVYKSEEAAIFHRRP